MRKFSALKYWSDKIKLSFISALIIFFPLPDRWVKLNHSPVCFGTRNDQFGTFNVPHGGNMAAVKLVYLYGYVSCDTRQTSYWSYWGCGDNPYAGIKDMVNVKITTSANHIILPPSQFTTAFYKWSKIPGYNSLSPELILSSFFQRTSVHSGQRLRLWYAEDLLNQSEGENGGRACCDVYGLYVWKSNSWQIFGYRFIVAGFLKQLRALINRTLSFRDFAVRSLIRE